MIESSIFSTQQGIETFKELSTIRRNSAAEFGDGLITRQREIENRAIELQFRALQESYLVNLSLGEAGAKGLAEVVKRSLNLAKATLSPLEYAQNRGKPGGGFFISKDA